MPIELKSFKMDTATHERYSAMETWDECMDRLYVTKDFSDFTIIVGTGLKQTSFAVHKWILNISSPVFDQIMYDSNATPQSSMTIQDAESKDVEIMLSHIYKRKVVLSSVEEALNVLSLAIYYKLPILKEICTNYTERGLDAENACSIYQRSFSLKHGDLFYKSFKFMQKSTSKVLEKTDLTDVRPSTMEDILKQDYLNVDSELQLLQSLIEWAKKQLKIQGKTKNPEELRKVLDPFLKYIRFLCIPQETFARIQNETKIFNHEELGMILMRFTITNWSYLPSWFNQCTTSRRYKRDVKPINISLVNWFNVNNDVYSHSEYVKSITSKFVAKANGFFIRRFVISICEKCLYRNMVGRKQIIKAKVGINSGNISREKSCEFYILSGDHNLYHSEPPRLDQCDPIILRKYFDKENVVYRQYLGMDAPIISSYLDPEPSTLPNIVDEALPSASKTIEIVPSVYVKNGEAFSLSMEINKETSPPFYCCRKKPLFDHAPFTVYNDTGKETEDYMRVWCAFASVDYFLPEDERLLQE